MYDGRLYLHHFLFETGESEFVGADEPQKVVVLEDGVAVGVDDALSAALNGGEPLDFFSNWTGLGAKASADVRFNDVRMWPYTPDNVHSNDFGWNAMPLGYTFANSWDTEFSGVKSYGCWWSATERNADQAYYRYIYCERPDFPMSYTSKTDMRASVRCVRTHPQSL